MLVEIGRFGLTEQVLSPLGVRGCSYFYWFLVSWFRIAQVNSGLSVWVSVDLSVWVNLSRFTLIEPLIYGRSAGHPELRFHGERIYQTGETPPFRLSRAANEKTSIFQQFQMTLHR